MFFAPFQAIPRPHVATGYDRHNHAVHVVDKSQRTKVLGEGLAASRAGAATFVSERFLS
jgi:hypothetical protein